MVAAKRATTEIPIVFASAGDPVGTGLIAKLARPGGNVTGLSNQLPDGAGKRIGLLREIIPDLRRLAIMTNISSPIGALEMSEAQAAAHKLGLEVLPLEIRRAEDIAPAFEALRGSAQALYVVAEPLAGTNMVRINTLALGLRGTKPGDIPVEQPTKFDLIINLTTAKVLGLTIPESILLRADEVIE